MSTSTLSKIFPKLDKICDAPFIRKVVGTTKKDAVIFLTDNQECRRFFEVKESEIDRHNELVQNDISDFLSQNHMQIEIAKFKACIKERQAREKVQKRELEKQAIIEEYLRTQDKEKREAEEREKLGMAPTTKTMIKPKEPTQKLETLSSSSDGEIEMQSASKENDNDSSEETVLNLDDFYQMFLAVYDGGHIQFKHGEKSVKAKIDMDNDSQKIVVQLKTSPTISIKK